jgi:hypothetical protein
MIKGVMLEDEKVPVSQLAARRLSADVRRVVLLLGCGDL